MSAGNRKNRWVPENQYSNPPAESNRRFVYIMALVITGGLLIGLILTSPKANAVPDTVEQQIAQLYQNLDNLKSKVEFLKKERNRSDQYAQCLKQHNRYLEQVLDGEKNYYAQPVCKR